MTRRQSTDDLIARLSAAPPPPPLRAALGMFMAAARGLPGDRILPAMAGHSAMTCLTAVTVLSLAPNAAGLAFLHPGAPTRPALSGGLVGLSAGGHATAGYALFCTEESPLFFVTWYGLAILIAGGIGALAGARILRW